LQSKTASANANKSLRRDPLLADRIKRLRAVPGVGPIAALTLTEQQKVGATLNVELNQQIGG
jgi:hypothetical protein